MQTDYVSIVADSDISPSPVVTEPTPTPTAEITPTAEVETGEDSEIIETTISGGLAINNATGFDVDIAELMAEGWSGSLPSEGVQILIIHTHGSEAYTPDTFNTYEASGECRTEDTQYNVIRVGDELASALEAQGLTVLHDREIYDYPSYTGSYSRAEEAIQAHLAEHPEIAVVIDLHRDALTDGETVYKTMSRQGGEVSSQLMMLVGTGENGLYHPYWRENLKLALAIQNELADTYPTLARPVALKQERYNQHLTTGSLILEVGSSGNTLPEALEAVRLFAECAAPVLKRMIAE
jgi:stage II sporulation protein P